MMLLLVKNGTSLIAGKLGDGGARADVDEDALASSSRRFTRPRSPGTSRGPRMSSTCFMPTDPLFQPFDRLAHDAVLAPLTAAMSTRAALRANLVAAAAPMCAARAMAMSVLVGMQPV